MPALEAELAEIAAEISSLESSLANLKDEAMADGVIDAEEQTAIDQLTDAIRITKRERDNIEEELNAAEQSQGPEEEGGSIWDAVSNVVEDVVEAVSDTVEKVTETVSDVAEDVADTALSAVAGNQISASVGKGSENDKDDTATVQNLLNKKGANLAVDGLIGPKTIGAITKFQEENCPPASGVIKPDDTTWNALKRGGSTVDALVDATGSIADAVTEFFEDDTPDDVQQIRMKLRDLRKEMTAISKRITSAGS